jgi:hypothetical protein
MPSAGKPAGRCGIMVGAALWQDYSKIFPNTINLKVRSAASSSNLPASAMDCSNVMGLSAMGMTAVNPISLK